MSDMTVDGRSLIRASACSLILNLSTAYGSEGGGALTNAMLGQSSYQVQKIRLELIREHKNASLTEVSADGRSIILWKADQRMITVRIPDRNFKDVSPSGKSELLHVGVADGKVLDSLAIGFLPTSVHFFPGNSRLIFSHSPRFGHFQTLLWDLEKLKPATCVENSLETQDATPIANDEIVALLLRKGNEHQIAKLHLPQCSVIATAPADPENSRSRNYTYHLQVSPDSSTLAYIMTPPSSGPRLLLIRRTEDLKVLHRILSPDEWAFSHVQFSPDSRLLFADIWLHGHAALQPDAVHRVLVYDVATGQVIRELNVDARYGLALSPDGTLLAAGQRNVKEEALGRRTQAVVVVYDLKTGAEVARTDHPWVKDRAGDPGGLLALEFAGGGAYLLTSTNDTRVWRISRKRGSPPDTNSRP